LTSIRKRRQRWILAPLALAALIACDQIDGLNGTAAMRPGDDCLQCHQSNGEGAFHRFSVAGTIFPTSTSATGDGLSEAEILIIDSTGRQLTLRSNGVGNFYTAETLRPPLTISAQRGRQRMSMLETAPTGACNSCHQIPGPQLAPGFAAPPGRIFVPTTEGP
jgi:mono/diheme cytochrome c family protein